MLRQYLMTLRTLWFGGLWITAYLVRPLLEQQGYFPHHGMEIIHATMGMGAGAGILMLLMMLVRRVFFWRQLPTQLLCWMTVLSLVYFLFMPWWRLQMLFVHMVAVLALVMVFVAPSNIVRRES